MENALKFTPSDGSVDVTSRDLNEVVQVSVADTGVGIPPDMLSQLFMMTGKVSTEGTDGEKGIGLGLLLCRDMVVKNGGRFWAESTPGEGTKVHFTLPRHRA